MYKYTDVPIRKFKKKIHFILNKKKTIKTLQKSLQGMLTDSTCGFSATYLAQLRISLIASMLVSGKAALHANSDKHFTASWNESSVAAKYFSKIFATKREKGKVVVFSFASFVSKIMR